MLLQGDAEFVTSADFVRNFGKWQDQASNRPIVVTHHGRSRLVVLSHESFSTIVEDRDLLQSAESIFEGKEAKASAEIIADNLEECFLILDKNLRVRHANSVACVYLRKARSQLIGRRLIDVVPEASGSLAYVNVLSALTSGTPQTLEIRSVVYPERWLRVRTFPFPNGAACLFRDMTEEIKGGQTIDLQRATYNALIAHNGIGHCVLTPRATFREVNAAFAAFMKLEPESLIRARFRDVFALACRSHIDATIEAVLDLNETRTLEAKILREGHVEQDIRLALTPIDGIFANGIIVIATAT